MDNWILVVGYSRPQFEAAQKEWRKYNISLEGVMTAPEAIERYRTQQYLAVLTYDIQYSSDQMMPDKVWPSVIERRFGTLITKKVVRDR